MVASREEGVSTAYTAVPVEQNDVNGTRSNFLLVVIQVKYVQVESE
jgi:hypothetical protein